MNWFAPVWLVTKRELRDQLRDWRILFPLIVLTLIFPLLMNEVAVQRWNLWGSMAAHC